MAEKKATKKLISSTEIDSSLKRQRRLSNEYFMNDIIQKNRNKTKNITNHGGNEFEIPI